LFSCSCYLQNCYLSVQIACVGTVFNLCSVNLSMSMPTSNKLLTNICSEIRIHP
jgi:hypothetical protein